MRLRTFALTAALGLSACTTASEAPPPAEPQVAPKPLPTVLARPAVQPVAPPRVAANPVLTVSGEFTQGGWLRGFAPEGTTRLRLGDRELEMAGDRSFFAGLDRDATGQATLRAELADGRSVVRAVAVTPREWSIERVNIARTPGGASEAFMEIRRPELEQIYSARAKRTGATGWRQNFVWPIKSRISGMFGRQRIYRGEPGSYHSGIDLAGGAGSTYVAPADGTVVLATREPFSLEGYLLIIDHGNGLNSAFLHNSAILVAEGDTVKQGQAIGRIGATGRATGPHLHWSVMWKDARLDPILLTGPM